MPGGLKPPQDSQRRGRPVRVGWAIGYLGVAFGLPLWRPDSQATLADRVGSPDADFSMPNRLEELDVARLFRRLVDRRRQVVSAAYAPGRFGFRPRLWTSR